MNKNKILTEIRLLLLLLAIGIPFYFLIKGPKALDFYLKTQCENEINNNYAGSVDRIIIQVKESYFFLENDTTIHFMQQHSSSILKKGDSIVKRKGKSQYVIYKKGINDSITLKFDCNVK